VRCVMRPSRHPAAEVCSLRCSAQYREAVRRAANRQPPRTSGWRQRPTPPRTWAQAKFRRLLLPGAEGAACALCGWPMFRTQGLDVDHIQPVSQGGLTILSNLRVVHRTCNAARGSELGRTSPRRSQVPPTHQMTAHAARSYIRAFPSDHAGQSDLYLYLVGVFSAHG